MITTEPQPPRERATFVEETLPNEPASDVKLTLDDLIKSDGTVVADGAAGTALRERMVKVDHPDGNGYTLVLTSTILDTSGNVVGSPSPPFEISFSGAALGRLGTPEAIRAAIDKSRQEAAALARLHFIGLQLGEQVLASRLGV